MTGTAGAPGTISPIDTNIPGTYTYKFKVIDSRGTSQDYGPFNYVVECGSTTIITPPFTSTQTVEFTKGASPSTHEVAIFTTDNAGCPITSYSASLITGITQPGCPSPPDSSVVCRQVTVDTSVVRDYSAITLTATADGGSSATSGQINFKVICPNNVVII